MNNMGDALIKGITNLIEKYIKSATFDKTFLGIVDNVNSDGTYNLIINENIYTDIRAINNLILIKDQVVLVLQLQNNTNQLFIIGNL